MILSNNIVLAPGRYTPPPLSPPRPPALAAVHPRLLMTSSLSDYALSFAGLPTFRFMTDDGCCCNPRRKTLFISHRIIFMQIETRHFPPVYRLIIVIRPVSNPGQVTRYRRFLSYFINADVLFRENYINNFINFAPSIIFELERIYKLNIEKLRSIVTSKS